MILPHTLNLTINNSSVSATDIRHVILIIGMVLHIQVQELIYGMGTNSAGCDSTATLNLTINNSDVTTSSVTACDSYIWDGVTYTSSGAYTNVYTNVSGCDSTHQ